jgi:SAM-dependent methyltransferase
MFREEAIWVENVLKDISPLPHNNRVANLGSSTGYFREVIQPHINKHIINPLSNNGWNIINIDLKEEDGVDIIADVTKSDFSNQLNSFALTICTNMLEHVEDIELVVKNLQKITIKGGYILLTVPYKYKKHLDPIDNMFRPTPQQIVDLFPSKEVEIIAKDVIVIHDKDYYQVKKSRIPFWGYRNIIAYHLGKKHAVSGVLIKIK